MSARRQAAVEFVETVARQTSGRVVHMAGADLRQIARLVFDLVNEAEDQAAEIRRLKDELAKTKRPRLAFRSYPQLAGETE